MFKWEVGNKGEVRIDLHIAYLGDREDGSVILWSYKAMKKLVRKMLHSGKGFISLTCKYWVYIEF